MAAAKSQILLTVISRFWGKTLFFKHSFVSHSQYFSSMKTMYLPTCNQQKKPAKIAGFQGFHLVTFIKNEEALLSITSQIYNSNVKIHHILAIIFYLFYYVVELQ